MKNISIDLSQEPGLGLVLKDYQEIAMKLLWKDKRAREDGSGLAKGLNSREVWELVNEGLRGGARDSISRASIINFLNSMVDADFLGFSETTGKGGHRRIYTARVDQEEFWKIIADETKRKMVVASGIKDIFG